MKKVIVVLSFVFSFCSVVVAQKHGIGIRLGDPMGITYKNYLRGGRAVEFGLGSASPAWHRGYYENAFESVDRYDRYSYRAHTVQSTLYLQGRYLLHTNIPIDGLIGNLDWYWGLGAMLKFSKVKYTFQGADPPFSQTDVRTDLDFGPEGIGGMEYTFQDVPVTIFGDVSLMLEIVDRVTLRPFAGIGARYNFKRLRL